MRRHDIADAETWFWARVEKTETCWLWRGRLSKLGYGQVGTGNRDRPTHRVSWELTFGPVPNGLSVCHSCDVRHCVRPDHLWLGTQLDNMRDCARKGRFAATQHPELMPRGEDNGVAKLDTGQVIEIRRLKSELHMSYHEIANLLGLNPGTVRDAGRGATWAHVAGAIENATAGGLRSTPRGEQANTAKLTAKSVAELRSLHAEGGWTFVALGKRFGVTATNARDVVLRKTWTHVA